MLDKQVSIASVYPQILVTNDVSFLTKDAYDTQNDQYMICYKSSHNKCVDHCEHQNCSSTFSAISSAST